MTSIVKDRNAPRHRHAWNWAWAMSPIARLATPSVTLLFALLLFGTAAVGDAGEAAQQEATPGAVDTTDSKDSANDATDDAARPFDLTEVGLVGLPMPLRTAEDFTLALRLIDERIAALRAPVEPVLESPPTDQTPGEAGGMDTQAPTEDAGNRGVDTRAAGAEPDRNADTEAADDDPRIASLERLRYMIERRAAIAEQVATANKSAALEQEQLARIESDVSMSRSRSPSPGWTR
jgi:hypothetical protein